MSHRPGQRFEALAAIRKAVAIGRGLGQAPAWFDPLRDEAIAALALPDAFVEQYRTETEPISVGGISEDRQRYVLAFATGDLVLRSMADHRELARLPRLDQQVRVHFIGNNDVLVTGSPGEAFELWDVSTLHPRRRWSRAKGCEQFNVSRDGRLLAVVNRDDVTVMVVPTGEVLGTQPSAPFFREPFVVLHPTDPLLLLHSYFCPEIEVRNWKTGETAIRLKPGNKDDYPGFSGADWSPDGKQLVVVNAHGDATHWYDVDPLTPRVRLVRTVRPSKEAAGGGPRVRFNAKGDRLLMMGWSHQLAILDSDRGGLIFASEALHGLSDALDFQLDPSGCAGGLYASPDQPRRFGVMSLAEGRELHPLLAENKTSVGHAAFDPTGAIVAICVNNGLLFVDAETDEVVWWTRWKGFQGYHLCFDATGNLYVSGQAACLSWPCRVTQGDTVALELGIPRRIHLPRGIVYLATSDDGSVLAAGAWNGFGTQEFAGCWIKNAGEPGSRKVIGQVSGTQCAVSPNGRHVVLSSDNGVTLANARQPTIALKELDPASLPHFSHDGEWLLAGAARYQVPSWEPAVIQDGAGVSFDLSPDGTQILTYTSAGALGLVDAPTGRVVARLEGPVPCTSPRFSPDGTLVLCFARGTYQLFDLRRIRAELTRLGLDWDAPPLPPAATARRPWKVVAAPELQSITTADALLELVDRRALQRARRDPQDGDAAFSAAMVAIENDDLTQAVELLSRSCDVLPDAITPRQWRAYAQAERRDFVAAIEDADWVLQRIDEADFRLLRAEWLFHAERFAAAVEDCTHVIGTNEKLRGLPMAYARNATRNSGTPIKRLPTEPRF